MIVDRFLTEEIDVAARSGWYSGRGKFLGHGKKERRLGAYRIFQEAGNCLELLGADAKMVEYERRGHWYSGEMLDYMLNP
jgi:hypothetical protein